MMGSYSYRDWSRLVGTPVEIWKDFRFVLSGVVDAAMPDSSAVWLAANGNQGRALFTAAEGYQVRIRPQERDGKVCYTLAATHRSGRS